MLPVVWLTTNPELDFWIKDDADDDQHGSVIVCVDEPGELAISALDLPIDVRENAVAATGIDPWSDWYVSFAPIPADRIRCILLENDHELIRFRTAVCSEDVLRFVAWESN